MRLGRQAARTSPRVAVDLQIVQKLQQKEA